MEKNRRSLTAERAALADDLPPRFGIEMAGDLGRAHQIAKKHRQMAALTRKVIAWLGDRRNRRGCSQRCSALSTEVSVSGINGAAGKDNQSRPSPHTSCRTVHPGIYRSCTSRRALRCYSASSSSSALASFRSAVSKPSVNQP